MQNLGIFQLNLVVNFAAPGLLFVRFHLLGLDPVFIGNFLPASNQRQAASETPSGCNIQEALLCRGQKTASIDLIYLLFISLAFSGSCLAGIIDSAALSRQSCIFVRASSTLFLRHDSVFKPCLALFDLKQTVRFIDSL